MTDKIRMDKWIALDAYTDAYNLPDFTEYEIVGNTIKCQSESGDKFDIDLLDLIMFSIDYGLRQLKMDVNCDIQNIGGR